MQEPVYVLHLITCHGRITTRLAELLFVLIFLFTKPEVLFARTVMFSI